MSYDDYFNRMEALQHYIKKECTGDAEELAEKIGVSRRTVFFYLENLRDKGHDIEYSRLRKTYYYNCIEKSEKER